MKALNIARKTLLELWREPLLLGLMLLFPTAVVGFYYIAFGQTKDGLSSYLSVLVLNDDAGAAMSRDSSFDTALRSIPWGQDRQWQAGAALIEVLRGIKWEGEPVFKVEVVSDRGAAEIALRERKASLLLVIPPDFTRTLMDIYAGEDAISPAVFSLVGDSGSESFVFARSFLNFLVPQFAKQFLGWRDDTLSVAYEFLPGTGTMADFHFGVGGIIVFGVMFAVIPTATVLVRENVNGTLRRLRLTRAGAGDLLLGVTLAQMAVVAVQIPITFGAALAMGFRSNGSLPLAMTVGLLLSLAAIGLGLMVACLARNDGEAANLGAGVLVPLVFISDALYPMPEAPLFTVAGRVVQIYDVSPATHAAEAMRQVLVLGEGAGAIAYELAALALLSTLFLAVGVVLYRRLRLRRY